MVVLKKYEIDANMELEKKRIEMEGIAKIAEQGPNSLNGFQLQLHTHTHAHDAANNSSMAATPDDSRVLDKLADITNAFNTFITPFHIFIWRSYK